MLSTQQIEFIKATVPVLRESGVALTDYFYKRMLNNHPELKETFNMGHQRSGGQAKPRLWRARCWPMRKTLKIWPCWAMR